MEATPPSLPPQTPDNGYQPQDDFESNPLFAGGVGGNPYDTEPYSKPYDEFNRPAYIDYNDLDAIYSATDLDSLYGAPATDFNDGYELEEDDPYLRPLLDENGLQMIDELGRLMFRQGKPLYDDMGRMLYDETGQPLYDDEVRLLYDEYGRMLYDEHGNPLFEDIVPSDFAEAPNQYDVNFFEDDSLYAGNLGTSFGDTPATDYAIPTPLVQTPSSSLINSTSKPKPASPPSSPRGGAASKPILSRTNTANITQKPTPTPTPTPIPQPTPPPPAANYDIFESILEETQQQAAEAAQATVVSTQRVPDSPHVRNLLSLLNPMIPSWYDTKAVCTPREPLLT